MQISQEMNERINQEIGRELLASNMYVNIAAYFDSLALQLLSKRFLEQATEERDHAMKFVAYLMEVGATVAIPAVDAPQASFNSVEEAVQLALEWEKKITQHIHDLMTFAIGERDYATQEFLRWFVTEQVEEVATMERLLSVVKQVGDRQILMVEAYLVHND